VLILAYIFAALAVCSLAYYALCIFAAFSFERSAITPSATKVRPVSLLKPVKGCDPNMYESLRSHCLQDHPEFEIVFGVNDASDEAIPFIEKLKLEYPHIPIKLVVSQQVLGSNRKVSNLIQMLRHAKHEHVLVNDADIAVPPNYLRDVLAGFDTPGETRIGMVTCLYQGISGKTIWSKLEAFGINVDFMASVLAARVFDGDVKFGLGSTLCTTKEAIFAVGGFEALVDYLADDYELGKRISENGYRVVISGVVVHTLLPDYDYLSFMDHQLRWGRTVRSSRPDGYFGMAVTFGMIWALLAVLASLGAWWSWAVLVAVLSGKTAVAYFVGKRIVLRSTPGEDVEFKRHLWLLPLREIVTPIIWFRSNFGNKIVWRGQVFELREGKLYPQNG
jgi:ceramide glucosyltransferase